MTKSIISLQEGTKSIFLNAKGKLNINPNLFVNTFLGLFLALIFNDIKNNLFDDLLLKIIKDNIKTKKVYIGNFEYDTSKIVDSLFHIIILIIFLLIVYFV